MNRSPCRSGATFFKDFVVTVSFRPSIRFDLPHGANSTLRRLFAFKTSPCSTTKLVNNFNILLVQFSIPPLYPDSWLLMTRRTPLESCKIHACD